MPNSFVVYTPSLRANPSRLARALPVPLALALTACAPHAPPACPPGELAATLDTLYFGSQGPAGTVTAEDWRGFLAHTVTPRFPEGLTAWEAAGQWRNRAGAVERETARVLQIVHPATPDSDAALRGIVADYKARFRQEAVLRVRAPVCASF